MTETALKMPVKFLGGNFIILSLTDPLGKNRILCHPGYSYDFICHRIPSLPNNYKCNVYIVGAKLFDPKKTRRHSTPRKIPEILCEFFAYSDADATPQGFEVMDVMDENAQKILHNYFGKTDQQRATVQMERTRKRLRSD